MFQTVVPQLVSLHTAINCIVKMYDSGPLEKQFIQHCPPFWHSLMKTCHFLTTTLSKDIC